MKSKFRRNENHRFAQAVLAIVFSAAILAALGGYLSSGADVMAQSAVVESSGNFRIGEKLAYNISFGKIPNAGYAEMHVVSKGKISGKDAVELRGRVKTIDIVSAAFFLLDESRTVFAVPETGLPHYLTTTNLGSVMPKEVVRNYLAQPTSNFDLLTMIYKARESGGIGTFPLLEGEQMQTVTFQAAGIEKVKVEAGEFETTVVGVQSEFLTANGIKELKINLSNDETKIPVLFRLKIGKNEVRAQLSSVTMPEPEPPAASPTPTPIMRPTPPGRPTPTPVAYVENQPIMSELGFQLGEVLDYRISAAGKQIGVLSLNARERKLFERQDSLLLTATVTSVDSGSDVLKLGDGAAVQVDPETLAPRRITSKFSSGLIGLNQTVAFDQRTGAISFGQKESVDGPVGTHSFLSLIYAMRSFNLKPSKDISNPVNDTRVAVFWESRSHVFTLRPAAAADVTIGGEKVPAQLISITTGIKELDALNLKVWLRLEDRVPVKFSAGPYQAELISVGSNLL